MCFAIKQTPQKPDRGNNPSPLQTPPTKNLCSTSLTITFNNVNDSDLKVDISSHISFFRHFLLLKMIKILHTPPDNTFIFLSRWKPPPSSLIFQSQLLLPKLRCWPRYETVIPWTCQWKKLSSSQTVSPPTTPPNKTLGPFYMADNQRGDMPHLTYHARIFYLVLCCQRNEYRACTACKIQYVYASLGALVIHAGTASCHS